MIRTRALLCAILLQAVSAGAAPEVPRTPTAPKPAETPRVEAPQPSEAPKVEAPDAEGPALPPGVVVGEPTTLAVPGDKPVYVIHAPADQRRVLVYLHGLCGRVEAVETWKQTIVAHGTLIGLSGDRKCPNGRTKWGKDTEQQHQRIQRAITAVKQARGGALDPTDLMLIGYSQGAARAFRLAKLHSATYSRLVLGGPPEPPSTEYLGRARAVAVLGGELETTERMREGTSKLQEAGKLARYFMLPASKHGEYGPEAERVMTEVLDWLGRVAP